MQSVNRMIKRGNAVVVFDSALKTTRIVTKRGTPKKQWNAMVKLAAKEPSLQE